MERGKEKIKNATQLNLLSSKIGGSGTRLHVKLLVKLRVIMSKKKFNKITRRFTGNLLVIYLVGSPLFFKGGDIMATFRDIYTMAIYRYIQEHNNNTILYKDIMEEFNITYPTVRKKIRNLIRMEKIIKKGKKYIITGK